jgi:hypothetical protein
MEVLDSELGVRTCLFRDRLDQVSPDEVPWYSRVSRLMCRVAAGVNKFMMHVANMIWFWTL